MALTSIDWDQVQVVKDPKKKQIETSFINAGGSGSDDSDDTPPGVGSPCLIWTGSYMSGGFEVLDASGEFFLTSTAAQILEANPYTVPVSIDVYDDSLERLTLQWADANGTHTKKVNVVREPDVTPYVTDTIELYVTEAQAQAIEGALGVHEVGSVGVVEAYTECIAQSWLGYYSAGDPCAHQLSALTQVGDRPVYLSVSGCFLPPPEQDPEPEDGVDVPPSTDTDLDECLGPSCTSASDYVTSSGASSVSSFITATQNEVFTSFPDAVDQSITQSLSASNLIPGSDSGPCGYNLYAPLIPSTGSGGRIRIGSASQQVGTSDIELFLSDLLAGGARPSTGTEQITIAIGANHYWHDNNGSYISAAPTYQATLAADYAAGTIAIDMLGRSVVAAMPSTGLTGSLKVRFSASVVARDDNPGGEPYYTFIHSVSVLVASSIGSRSFEEVSVDSAVGGGWGYNGTTSDYLAAYADIRAAQTTPVYLLGLGTTGDAYAYRHFLRNLEAGSTTVPAHCERLP